MDGEKIIITNVKVEYITTKIDAYDNELCYFKFRDKHIDSKLAVIIKENFKYPWFVSDKGEKKLKKEVYETEGDNKR